MSKAFTADEIDSRLGPLEGWSASGTSITKTFEFEDFGQAMDFVNHVASAAEEQDHHPDIDIRFNKVTLNLSSHDAGGVTEKDIKLAEAIEEIGE
ncbi:4a-hydroxytetrahydrobiopterin dehydratase [Patescibacteria group bacterium]|nr:4a-hydroxytetrahydrobiopterin dehydratase [Patescibacteria group bacterium]